MAGPVTRRREEIERRAADARGGTPGVAWDELKRAILKREANP